MVSSPAKPHKPFPAYAAIVALTAVLLAILGVVCLNFYRLNQAEHENAQTYQILLEVQVLQESLINMESSLRGFVLTGNTDFLAPYDKGRIHFQSSLERALQLTATDAQQQAYLHNLQQKEIAWQALYQPVIALRPVAGDASRSASSSTVSPAAVMSAAAPGILLRTRQMDSMQDLLEEIEARENAQLARREREMAALRGVTTYTLWGGTVFALLLAAGLAVVLSSDARQLWRANERLQQEVEERLRIEAILRTSEERFRLLIENAGDMITIVDQSGCYVYESPSVERLLGYDRQEQAQRVGQSVFEAIHPDDRNTARAALQESVSTQGEPVRAEFRYRHRDGSWRVLESIGTVLSEGDFAGMTVVNSRDITTYRQTQAQLREAEAQLREATAQLQAILQALPDLYFRLDAGGTIIDYNAPDLSHFYVAPQEFLQRRVQDVLPPDVAELIEQAIGQIQTEQNLVTIEYSLVISDNVQRWYEARLLPLQSTQGDEKADETAAQLIAIVRDITDRRNVERMKSEFISTVSHELRTPLTSIRGSLGLLVSGVAGEIPASAAAMIDIAHKNSARLMRLINDILDVEKIESGKMTFSLQPLEVSTFLQSSLEANQGYAEEYSVEFQLEDKLPPQTQVQADPDRMMQVMANLLSNAAKFSPAGSTVIIESHRRENQVCVEVRDQGPGIADEFLPRIFGKFAQADSSDTRQKGGTGLGLNISKSIVEKMGGTIDFHTEIGEGTTFFFEMPEYSSEYSAQRSTEYSDTPDTVQNDAESTSVSTTLHRVLICEDDEDVAFLLAEMLRENGFVTEIAQDAEAAHVRLKDERFDGLILDLSLPGQDGVALIRALRADEQTRELPIVVVSARADEGRREINGEAFRIIDWMNKPVEADRLIVAVGQAVAMSSRARPHILHIEDDVDVQRVVAQVLAPLAEVTSVGSVREAEQILGASQMPNAAADSGISPTTANHFDLAVLDLKLDDGSGWHLLSLLRTQNPPVPVVIFSSQEINMQAGDRVEAALVKSRTSNQELLETIESLLRPAGP